MGTGVIQTSFTSGELSPSLLGRVDLNRYQNGLQTCRNFIVRQYGGVSNRPGSTLVHEAKYSDTPVRLIEFQFSTVQTYILEFGHQYMRIHKDGETVYSGGSPVEIATPWLADDLFDLSYTQSADILTVCHPDYPTKQISRYSHVNWTITNFDPKLGPLKDINVDEAKSIYSGYYTPAGGGMPAPCLIANWDAFTDDNVGDLVYLEQMPDASTEAWEVNKAISNGEYITANGHFYMATSANPITTFTHEGSTIAHKRITGTTSPDHTEGKEWDGTGNLEGAVYRAPNTDYNADAYVGVEWEYQHSGFGIVQITNYVDARKVGYNVVKTLPPSLTTSPGTYKWALSAWSVTEGYPAATGYHNQRQLFGGTPGQPQTVWMSAVKGFNDFGTSMPILDDEAISFTLASREVNEIRHFLPLSELILLTSGGEWLIRGDSSGAILPSTINARAQGFGGSSRLAPIVVGSTALYVQDKGSQVRSLGYSFEQDAFIGNDLTVLSSHLFYNRSLVDWAYQKIPFSVAWCVRDDGTLLGLTYMREQEVVGWFKCDTDGYYESVASISEGGEDAVYFVVRRTINGTERRFIERMDSRYFGNVKDCKFLDCSLSYDGRNSSSTTMTITGGTNWDQTETVTVTASASFFPADAVGDEIVYYSTDGQTYRLRVIERTSATVVQAIPNRIIPAEYRVARSDWAFARNQFAGIDHLEGKTVSILADGHVHPQQVVTSGTVTLQYCASVVHIGLPYTADMKTLPLSVQGQQIRDKQKLIAKVKMICEESVGVFAGPDANHLMEYKQRSTENYDEAIAPATGMFEVSTIAEWNENGVVMIRQSDPLPLTVLAIIPDVTIGG